MGCAPAVRDPILASFPTPAGKFAFERAFRKQAPAERAARDLDDRNTSTMPGFEPGIRRDVHLLEFQAVAARQPPHRREPLVTQRTVRP